MSKKGRSTWRSCISMRLGASEDRTLRVPRSTATAEFTLQGVPPKSLSQYRLHGGGKLQKIGEPISSMRLHWTWITPHAEQLAQ